MTTRALAADVAFAPVSPDQGVGKRPVYVDWGGCDPVGEIGSILRVELASRLVDSPPSEEAYRTIVTCTAGVVAISVGVPGGVPESFQTNLAGTPANVRSRIVALALAELVRDLDRAPPPTVALPAPHPPAGPREADVVSRPPSPPRHGALGAFAETSSFELNGVWLAGGGFRFDYAYRSWFAGLDGALLTRSERFEPGTAQIFLGYGSPHAGWEVTSGRAQLRLGAGYALGAATLSGHATGSGAFGGTTTGPWTAPYGFSALALGISERFSFNARGQLGWVTSPVVGEVAGGADAELKGLWVSFQAGVAIAL